MFMKKTTKITAVILAVVIGLAVVVLAAYDSSEDPLVSLSYLSEIFKREILGIVDTKIDALRTELSDAQPSQPAETEQQPAVPSTAAGYEVVELTEGDEIYAISPCDIMLRAGTAVCIAPDANQGISDYTDGVELYNGYAFTKNHMCLIPRGDGRGLRATSISVFIEIRGEYTIVKNK